MGALFQEQLSKRILILDGAMGTMLQQQGLTADDFGGAELEGCNEILNKTRPALIQAIHESYLKAGADIIETNSFGATSVVLKEYGLEAQDRVLNEVSARLAREMADRYTTTDKPRFVAGSMGPTTKMLALTGGITFTELEEAYYRQTLGLLEGGVDLLLIETAQDTLNLKAAGLGIRRAFSDMGREVPIMLSSTIEPSGTMLAGQNIEAFYISTRHLNPVTVGLNCGTGAELMNDSLRTLDGMATCGVGCYPNAGLPDEEGIYQETPQEFAEKMVRYAQNGWLNVVGGCCGTTDKHIEALAKALQGIAPRKAKNHVKSTVSGVEILWLEEENRPILVGERTNVIGSRKFKELITEGHLEEGAEIARNQVKKGAQVIDICVANPDRNELEDLLNFLPHVVNRVKAPLMLDSTDPVVIEAGLRLTQGKAIINSINLENGLERFEDTVPLIKNYGAAVVVGLIDEEGMAISRERKLQVAQRSYDLLVQQFGIEPQDIIFDPLTFPVGTGDSKYLGSATETIEGLRLIKQRFPECKTILGVSNVSFGLPAAGREVLNAVFVYLTTLAGLDFAIVNAEKLERYATLAPEEKRLAQDLLLQTGDRTLKDFTDYYREKKVVEKKEQSSLPLEERLADYIITGSKDGLEKDIHEALSKYQPLEIINGPLMKGMERVGELFNQNQLIVAEVLQSAEVMKAAVTLLKPHMEKAEEAVKGKVLLATVKGDVHDIGKNLVEIILSNNGYEVVNLGVKVTSEQIIEAAQKERPQAIGLSGLLVKSVQQMLLTAQDLQEAGIHTPLLLGGAALSRRFTEEKIAPAYGGPVRYARDAMESLGILSALAQEVAIPNPSAAVKNGPVSAPTAEQKPSSPERRLPSAERGLRKAPVGVTFDTQALIASRTERTLLLDYPLERILPYLNLPLMMTHYLGIRGVAKRATQQESSAIKKIQARHDALVGLVQDFLQEILTQKLIQANGVYGFFPANGKGERVRVGQVGGIAQEEFHFPRQKEEHGLCLADFIRRPEDQAPDYLGMLVLTTGVGVKELARQYQEQGEYLKSYLIQVFALEFAEGFAEVIHEQMRKVWGIPEQGLSIQDKLKGKYQGIRVSPGYPVCPVLEDQQKIFRLLRPEELGVQLTESCMMEPEASVTALVFSHPQARIFPMG